MSRFLSALFLMLSVTGIFAQTNLPDIPTLLDRNKNDLGISTATFYKWRAKYGGMDTHHAHHGERGSHHPSPQETLLQP